MTQPVSQDQRTFRFFAVYLLSFYVVWISWALLLVRHPTLNQDGILRAVIRLLIWVAPACAFVRWVEGPPLLVRLGLRDGIWRGILIGLVGLLPVVALIVVEHGPSIQNFRLPANAAVWLNPVLSAPFAEEIVFRGVVFRNLRPRLGVWGALPVSALLFALIHLPYWWMSGDKAGAQLWIGFASIFAYGLLFAGLFQCSGSLWSPLVCHWLNNLITQSLVK